MFDRPKSGELAILVLSGGVDEPYVADELSELAKSAGAEPVGVLISRRVHPDPKFLVGQGKVSELLTLIGEYGAELVIFNHSLTPSQERNLEKALGVRVIDRTGLILDIFAQRAQSYEGKLQVELAQLKHLSTRLVRGWTHLERQKGGIGLRGPGETQLETDKRLIGRRIDQIQKRLEKVDRQRDQGRRARRRTEVPVLGLVGYTNAGKSTLLNALTGAGVFAEDQLFATLDPTLRGFELARGYRVILADTVGFVRDLPHELVAAFRSTLKETVEADLLLHVVDVTDERMLETMDEVDRVITEIGAGEIPRIRIMNKIDGLLDGESRIERDATGEVSAVWLSALTGEGLPRVGEVLLERLFPSRVRHEVRILPSEGGIRARLYRNDAVVSERPDEEGGWIMEIEGNPDHLRFLEPQIMGRDLDPCPL